MQGVIRGLTLGLALVGMPALADERKVDAVATWLGTGQLFKVGPDRAYFAGSFEGGIFVQSDDGAELNAAQLVCPAQMDVSLVDGSQAGTGHCIITSAEGEVVYGAWTCTGTHGRGCAGTFTFTGGTGRFEGIAGSGPFVVRTALGGIAADALAASVAEAALGVAIWTDLTLQLP